MIGFSLAVAVACSDKKDDTSVGPDPTDGAVTTPDPATTTGPATTVADTVTTTPSIGSTDSTDSMPEDTTPSSTAPPPSTSSVPVQETLPPPEGSPVTGGRLVVAGEAEVAEPWTPENVRCDSYCQMRIRTFIEPLMVIDLDQEVQPFLAEAMTPNEDATVWTIKVRQGITFTDGTPLNADAVIDNLNRTSGGLLVSGALRDTAKNADGTLVTERLDEFTFTVAMGHNGDVDDPVSWWLFPHFLAGQAGFIASPTWLAAVDADATLATQAVGTGPFILREYLPNDRMTVVRNEDYWRQDAEGNQLPYLDEIEFRVIIDSQVRAQSLESGDVDLIATSDPSVVTRYVDRTDFVMLQQDVRTETNYIMLHLTKPQFADREVRCALVQAVDKQALIDAVYAGFSAPANGPFSPGQDGYLEDNGLPPYDPEAASAAIEAWEADNGPVTINYSTTPTGTNRALAEFLQQAWGAIGVDMTINAIEQSALITNAALGTEEFEAFGWRNHAGQWVDTQTHWWHGFAMTAAGDQAVDGALALNFGRLNDPRIDELLEEARSTEDEARRIEIAQDINRQFGSECWIIPTTFTTWGIIMNPAVQNIGRDVLPGGGGTIADGAGFPGQVWLTAVFKAE